VAIEVVFETHSITEDNEQGRATGWLPGRPSPQGRELARELGLRRQDDGIGAVFSSDLRRERGDLITAVELPPLGCARNSAYRKVRDRASYAFAVVSVAAALDVADDRVRDVRLAIGAVAPVPWRARTAERVLAGRPATAQWFGRAADAELAAAAPLPDNAFKVTLARNVIVRMLCELAGTGLAGTGPAGAGS
jgi:CO/xanthine dehydrogenase FAD-binding subunit